MMQTVVLKVSLTVDPVKLVAWAKAQMDVCCPHPAHSERLLDWMKPEITAQSILAHTFLSTVPEEITDGGMVETLETGIPPEIIARIEREYQAAFAEFFKCDGCGEPATEGFVDNPYAAEIYGASNPEWYCKQCYNNALGDI